MQYSNIMNNYYHEIGTGTSNKRKEVSKKHVTLVNQRGLYYANSYTNDVIGVGQSIIKNRRQKIKKWSIWEFSHGSFLKKNIFLI